MVIGQGLPAQLICHIKPHNNRNFQIDGTSRYFGVWVWQLVYLLMLLFSFQWCVLFLCLVRLYSSCPSRDKGLSPEAKANGEHKKNVWEITQCPGYALKCNKSVHLPAWLSFLCLLGDLVVIWAWFSMGALQVISRSSSCDSSSFITWNHPERSQPKSRSNHAQITTKSPKRHKKDT